MKNGVIFSTCQDSEFFGRQREIDYICHRVTEKHKFLPGMFLTGKRWIGKTEILRRVHQKLFWSQTQIAPVYYQFKSCCKTEDFAEDYIKEIVKQYIAFIRRDTQIIKAETSLDKLEQLLIDTGVADVTEFIARYREVKESGDYIATLKTATAAPHIISLQSKIPIFLILDDIYHAGRTALHKEEKDTIMEFLELLKYDSFPFLIASPTKKIFEGKALNGFVEIIRLGGLEEEPAVSMMIGLCQQYNIKFDKEILALIFRKLEGNPLYIKNIMWVAHKTEKDLIDIKTFAEIYTDELIEGNLGFLLCSAIPLENLKDLRVLYACACLGKETSGEEIAKRLRYSYEEVERTVERLIALGLLEKNLGSIRWTGDTVMKDFINYMHETRVRGRSTEEVKTWIIREELEESFRQKGIKVEGRIKEEIREILNTFNGQKVLKALLHNQVFTVGYKDGVYRPKENEKEDAVILPQVVGCFGAPKGERNGTVSSVVIAHGFQNNRYDTANEVTWIVGIKDSMSPVDASDAENFIRQSSVLREDIKIGMVVRWFIGTEGFTAEAQERFDSEDIYSTDAIQLRILKNIIENKEPVGRFNGSDTIVPNKEFDVVLPKSLNAELVAARAAEEIGKEMGFDENAISQIKTALIEACINAIEHGKINDGNVYLRFVVGNDRLVIHVENKGTSFDRLPMQSAISDTLSGLPRKRGWGLELIKNLMDDVRLETLKNGTKLVMLKYLLRKGENGNDNRKL